MKYVGLLILLASTLMPSQDTAKFYLIAVDGFTLENAQQNPAPPTNSAAAPPSGSGTEVAVNHAAFVRVLQRNEGVGISDHSRNEFRDRETGVSKQPYLR